MGVSPVWLETGMQMRHWWSLVHCLWHKLTISFLAIALVKKPGAILAGWSRRYFRRLSCSCPVSVPPGFCVLWGKNHVWFEICVGIYKFSCYSVFASWETVTVNSLASQPLFLMCSNEGVLAICILSVFVTWRISSAMKELPDHADCNP